MRTLQEVESVALVGVRGSGMLALAQIFSDWGREIHCFDHQSGELELVAGKVTAVKDFSALDSCGAQVAITSTAHLPRPQLEAWRQVGKLLTYQQALAQIFDQRFGIAVAGSHGKSTSAAMTGFLMTEIGLEPDVLVGGEVINQSRNGWGSRLASERASVARGPQVLVAEVDEYQDKFNSYGPRISLITNVEYEHPDFFRDRDSCLEVFYRFVLRTWQNHGLAVVNIDDPFLADLARLNPDHVVTFGFSPAAQWRLTRSWQKECMSHFEVQKSNRLYRFNLKVPGTHNARNALGAMAAVFAAFNQLCLKTVGLGPNESAMIRDLGRALAKFLGVRRRIEYLGEWHGQLVYDDYAHHHTQVEKVIQTLRACHPEKPITVVFEPHSVSRTRTFKVEFGTALAAADRVLVLPVYQAWRDLGQSLDTAQLADQIGRDTSVSLVSDFEQAAASLAGLSKAGVLVLMGAGAIGNLWPYLKGLGNVQVRTRRAPRDGVHSRRRVCDGR